MFHTSKRYLLIIMQYMKSITLRKNMLLRRAALHLMNRKRRLLDSTRMKKNIKRSTHIQSSISLWSMISIPPCTSKRVLSPPLEKRNANPKNARKNVIRATMIPARNSCRAKKKSAR
jgi:hypothetical protein